MKLQYQLHGKVFSVDIWVVLAPRHAWFRCNFFDVVAQLTLRPVPEILAHHSKKTRSSSQLSPHHHHEEHPNFRRELMPRSLNFNMRQSRHGTGCCRAIAVCKCKDAEYSYDDKANFLRARPVSRS